MSYKLSKYEFEPGRSEHLETTLILEKETRSAIHGTVIDSHKRPLKDAVVKLFEMPDKENCRNLIPLSYTFTDEWGNFVFGPLTPGKYYIVKVWYNSAIIKNVPAKSLRYENPCVEDDTCNPKDQ